MYYFPREKSLVQGLSIPGATYWLPSHNDLRRLQANTIRQQSTLARVLGWTVLFCFLADWVVCLSWIFAADGMTGSDMSWNSWHIVELLRRIIIGWEASLDHIYNIAYLDSFKYRGDKYLAPIIAYLSWMYSTTSPTAPSPHWRMGQIPHRMRNICHSHDSTLPPRSSIWCLDANDGPRDETLTRLASDTSWRPNPARQTNHTSAITKSHSPNFGSCDRCNGLHSSNPQYSKPHWTIDWGNTTRQKTCWRDSWHSAQTKPTTQGSQS